MVGHQVAPVGDVCAAAAALGGSPHLNPLIPCRCFSDRGSSQIKLLRLFATRWVPCFSHPSPPPHFLFFPEQWMSHLDTRVQHRRVVIWGDAVRATSSVQFPAGRGTWSHHSPFLFCYHQSASWKIEELEQNFLLREREKEISYNNVKILHATLFGV